MMTKTCTLLFLLKDDHILLAMKKRGFGADRYNGVGGKIEPGETIEQALVRECQEEIGVTPIEFQKVAWHDFRQSDGTAPWQMVVHVYTCSKWQGKPIETDEMCPEWFSLTSIPYEHMWDDDRHWLPAVLAGKRVHGYFEFDDNERVIRYRIEDVEMVRV